MSIKLKDVLGLEITVYNAAVEIDECVGNVREHVDGDRKVHRPAGGFDELSQRLLCLRHDQNPEVVVLTAVDDRDDVPAFRQVDEQELAISAGRLRNKLCNGGLVAAYRLIDLTTATATEVGADCPGSLE